MPRFRAGTLVARRYRLEAPLGGGAMGEVWRARHEELNTNVALKLALVDEARREPVLARFRFEAQVGAQLAQKTRRVVAVHDAGMHEGVPFLVMEYVAGGSLEQRIQDRGALPPPLVAELVEHVAEALDVAHALGIWHRDIKPANIMIVDHGDDRWEAKVADFGVAKSMGTTTLDLEAPKTTMDGVLVGTPQYMSPEQIQHRGPSGASDRWSLAIVAYEALTGSTAFDAPTLTELMVLICSQPHVPLAGKGLDHPALEAWFDRALAKDPAARFADGREMATSFARAIAGRPRRRWPVGLAAALALAAAVGAAAALWPEGEVDTARPALAPAILQDRHASAAPSATPTVAHAAPTPAPTPSVAPPAPSVAPPAPNPSLAAPPAPGPRAPLPPPHPAPPPKPFDPSEVL